jgi:YVTN family beta-propeller protein
MISREPLAGATMTDSNRDDTPNSVQSEGGAVIKGDVNLDHGSTFVGRDQIINHIQSIQQRALTAAEEAKQARSIELEYLAQGVSAFAQRLHDRAAETEDSCHPYKGLLEYRLGDAEIFFGREHDIRELLPRQLNMSLTVLHSESGAGKTSLLQAGLSPQLIAAGHLPLYCRPYDVSPALKIKQTLLPDLAHVPQLAAAPLREFLGQVRRVIGPRTTLVILLDQFEEFFIRPDEKTRAAFINELADCLEDDTLNVHWVLALRSEYFSNLATFRPRIRNPFENDYRLGRLARADAEAVIALPADRLGVTFEAGLIDRLLDDLGQDDIAPPQIQLVCSALYSERGDARVITREIYEREGGAAGILRGHLERVLGRDVPVEQRSAARQVLEALISSEPRRILRPRVDLIAELQARGVSAETTDAVVAQLIDSRLVRPVGEGEVSYELVHDYLLDEIKLDPAVQARKAAQELLDREVQSYQRYGTLLSDDKLAILQPRRGELRLTPDAQALLDKSEWAFKRRRGLLLGGVGLVAALVLIGVLASIAAIGATGAAQQANDARQQSVTQATAAAQERNQAQQQALIAQQSMSTAIAREGQAKSSEATAVAREAVANRALTAAFQQTGIVPVGQSPSALTWADGKIWVANSGDNVVQAIDPKTGLIVQTIPTGQTPTGLAFDGSQLWVANTSDDTIQPIDPVTGRVGDPLAVITRPVNLRFEDQHLWIVGASEEGVNQAALLQRFDPATRQFNQPIEIRGNSRSAYAFDGRTIWTGKNLGVQVIDRDTAQSRVKGYEAWEEGDAFPAGFAYDGRRVWVFRSTVNGVYTVWAIDPAMDTVRGPVAGVDLQSTLGYGDFFLSTAFDGTRLWLANRVDNTLLGIDVQMELLSVPLKTGNDPAALLVVEDQLWVANRGDNTVQVFNLSTIPSQPRRVQTTPTELLAIPGQLWVADVNGRETQILGLDEGRSLRSLPFAGYLAWDGRQVWVADPISQTVNAVDPATYQVGQSVAMTCAPQHVLADSQRVWAACWNEVQEIDPAIVQVVARYPTENHIEGLAYDGQRLWISTYNPSPGLESIEPRPEGQRRTIQVGALLGDLIFDGEHLWVVNQLVGTLMGNVLVIDPDSSQEGRSNSEGNLPTDLLSAGRWLWVTYAEDNTVQAVDRITGQRLATWQVGREPGALAFDGRRVWVANSADNTIQAIYPALGSD